nr:MAG TPA: hypothetical protein [Caudoviricetes sp.]
MVISFMHQKPLGTANTEGFYLGLGCRCSLLLLPAKPLAK